MGQNHYGGWSYKLAKLQFDTRFTQARLSDKKQRATRVDLTNHTFKLEILNQCLPNEADPIRAAHSCLGKIPSMMIAENDQIWQPSPSGLGRASRQGMNIAE